jgi:hypothetical protein
MKYVWFIALITYARFLITAVWYPPGDGDLAWQRWLGRTILSEHRIPRVLGYEAFSAVGASWTPQEWLFGIAASLGADGWGWKIFAVSVALCATLAVVLVAYRIFRRGVPPMYVACAAAAMSLAQLSSFGVRAQVVAWPMLAGMLLIIDTEGPWLWAALPVAAFWSNIHASAILAPFLVGAVAMGRGLEDRAWTPRVRLACTVTAATCLAICCNPFGWGLPLYAISLFHSPIKIYISEWKATGIDTDAFLLGALPMLLCIVALGAKTCSRRKIKTEDMLIFIAFTYLLFFAARNIAIFSIVAAPLLAQILAEAFPVAETEEPSQRIDRIAAIALPVFAVALTVLVGYGLFHSDRRVEVSMPYHEVDALVAMRGEHRILCADFAWCSYFVGKPGQRVFLDGRADPYPPEIWKGFASVAYLRPDWRDVLERYRVDAVIVRNKTPIDQAMALTHRWRDAARDEKFRLWVHGKE